MTYLTPLDTAVLLFYFNNIPWDPEPDKLD